MEKKKESLYKKWFPKNKGQSKDKETEVWTEKMAEEEKEKKENRKMLLSFLDL